MSDAVPLSLFLTRRALCPTCGAPLQLQPDSAVIDCGYCHSRSSVERRLRHVEATISGGLEPTQVARKDTRWLAAHSIAAAGQAESSCPGCGAPIEINNAQDVARCSQCGSAAKVERQLVAAPAALFDEANDDAELEAFKGRPLRDFEEENRSRRFDDSQRDDFWDEACDQTVRVLLTSSDLATRFRAARSFRGWKKLNPWRERMLARVMQLCCRCEPELEYCICNRMIESMLFDESGDELKQGVFRAAARALFIEQMSGKLLFTLGLAFDAATLKLLLDLMEYALAHGRLDDAMNAMRGAFWALDRDYGSRMAFGEVMLYRLLYLTPALLSWVLDQFIKWQVDDFRKIVRLVDDCAFERPELIPIIRKRLGAPVPPSTFEQYAAHLEFVKSLVSPQAREFAVFKYPYNPEYKAIDQGIEHLQAALDYLVPLMGDPLFEKTVTREIVRMIEQLEFQNLPPIHGMLKTHGEKLPMRVRFAYLRRCPDTPLIAHFHPDNLYEPEDQSQTPLEQELERWKRVYRDGWDRIKQVDDDRNATYKEFLEKIEREDEQLFEQRKAEREIQSAAQALANGRQAQVEHARALQQQAEIQRLFDEFQKADVEGQQGIVNTTQAAETASLPWYKRLWKKLGG